MKLQNPKNANRLTNFDVCQNKYNKLNNSLEELWNKGIAFVIPTAWSECKNL